MSTRTEQVLITSGCFQTDSRIVCPEIPAGYQNLLCACWQCKPYLAATHNLSIHARSGLIRKLSHCAIASPSAKKEQGTLLWLSCKRRAIKRPSERKSTVRIWKLTVWSDMCGTSSSRCMGTHSQAGHLLSSCIDTHGQASLGSWSSLKHFA